MMAYVQCTFTLDFAGHFSDLLAADAAGDTLKSILEGRLGTGTVKVTRSVSDPAVGSAMWSVTFIAQRGKTTQGEGERNWACWCYNYDRGPRKYASVEMQFGERWSGRIAAEGKRGHNCVVQLGDAE
jgi:hypothetical protein